MSGFSHSQLSTFNRCKYLWQLQYQRDIHRVSITERVELGTAVHTGLAAYFKNEDIVEGLDKWADGLSPSWREIGDDSPDMTHGFDFDSLQASQVSLIHKQAYQLCLSTLAKIGNSWEVLALDGEPLVERHLEVDGFQGYVDLVIREKDTNFVFLVDFKVRAAMQEAPDVDVDQQMALYQHLLQVRGIETMGSIIYQIRSSLPKRPKLNKDGTMSRADIATNWETYRDELLKQNLEPSDYLDMQGKLWEKEFQKPIKTYRSEETVRAFWDNAQSIVEDIKVFDTRLSPLGDVAPRNFNQFHCPTCMMASLCRAEFDNQPTDHLFVDDYVKETQNDTTTTDNSD